MLVGGLTCDQRRRDEPRALIGAETFDRRRWQEDRTRKTAGFADRGHGLALAAVVIDAVHAEADFGNRTIRQLIGGDLGRRQRLGTEGLVGEAQENERKDGDEPHCDPEFAVTPCHGHP